jgi:copper(I)-binding protein
MKWILLPAAALLLVLFVSNETHAQTSMNTIKIEQAWARATPGGARTGAAYMT